MKLKLLLLSGLILCVLSCNEDNAVMINSESSVTPLSKEEQSDKLGKLLDEAVITIEKGNSSNFRFIDEKGNTYVAESKPQYVSLDGLEGYIDIEGARTYVDKAGELHVVLLEGRANELSFLETSEFKDTYDMSICGNFESPNSNGELFQENRTIYFFIAFNRGERVSEIILGDLNNLNIQSTEPRPMELTLPQRVAIGDNSYFILSTSARHFENDKLSYYLSLSSGEINYKGGGVSLSGIMRVSSSSIINKENRAITASVEDIGFFEAKGRVACP